MSADPSTIKLHEQEKETHSQRRESMNAGERLSSLTGGKERPPSSRRKQTAAGKRGAASLTPSSSERQDGDPPGRPPRRGSLVGAIAEGLRSISRRGSAPVVVRAARRESLPAGRRGSLPVGRRGSLPGEKLLENTLQRGRDTLLAEIRNRPQGARPSEAAPRHLLHSALFPRRSNSSDALDELGDVGESDYDEYTDYELAHRR